MFITCSKCGRGSNPAVNNLNISSSASPVILDINFENETTDVATDGLLKEKRIQIKLTLGLKCLSCGYRDELVLLRPNWSEDDGK